MLSYRCAAGYDLPPAADHKRSRESLSGSGESPRSSGAAPEKDSASGWQPVEMPAAEPAAFAPAPAPKTPAPADPFPARPEAPAASFAAQLSPEVIERIADEVVRRISDRVVREIAWEVIPQVAETLVTRRIKELEEGGGS